MKSPDNHSRGGQMSVYSAQGARKYLTSSERKRFLRATRRIRLVDRLFCLVVAWSGGRISEVLALTASSFDLDAGTVALVTLKRRRSGLVRQIVLPPFLVKTLMRNLNLKSAQRDPERAAERLWPWSRVTGWRRIKRVMALADIRGLGATAKGLRHTFGVHAFQANVPPHLVQRWLGHASLRTTAIYADVLGQEERRFASRMWREESAGAP